MPAALGRARTSDQEQWAAAQAERDVAAALSASGSGRTFELTRLYAGPETVSPATIARIEAFAERCARDGAPPPLLSTLSACYIK